MTDNLTQEFKDEVRKQATQQAAKWTLAGVIALVVIAGSGWWLYLKPKIDEYIASTADGLPAGAVVAFLSSESQTCPGEDWTLFHEAKGRFIVGAGSGENLTVRILEDTGGEETVTLQASQIPNHQHSIELPDDSHSLNHGTNDPSGSNTGKSAVLAPYWYPHSAASPITLESNAKGITSGNQIGAFGGEHNNMPPYIALYFCIKV